MYEYISQYQTILWEDPKHFVADNCASVKVKKGDLFALLKIIEYPDKPDLLFCKVLMVQSGLIGEIVCYKGEIQVKKNDFTLAHEHGILEQ